MIVKHPPQLPFFTAGDETLLTEVLHPKNDLIELPFSIAYATIAPGKTSLPHTLSGSETYIFTDGKGEITVNEKTQKVQKGVVVFVPENARQFVENQGDTDLCFYCIVTPAWSEESEDVEESKNN
jgi:Mannose-6-phosphate isomerase